MPGPPRGVSVSGEVRLLDESGATRRLLLALETLVSSVSPERFALGAWCAERVRNDFVDDAPRISSKIHQSPTSRPVTPDEVRQIGLRFVETLASSDWSRNHPDPPLAADPSRGRR